LDLLVFIFVLALVILAIYVHFSRGRMLLERWADDNRYTIIRSDYRFLMKGPFFFLSGRGNAVYYVEVLDMQGITRRGYVRCGSFWFGMWLSDEVTVRWDD